LEDDFSEVENVTLQMHSIYIQILYFIGKEEAAFNEAVHVKSARHSVPLAKKKKKI